MPQGENPQQRTVRTREGHVALPGPYPVNTFDPEIIVRLSEQIVHHLAAGQEDIDGNAFDRMFADTIGGKAYQSPLGVADVAWGEHSAWSIKTIKNNHPHRFTVDHGKNQRPKHIRLIIGRTSPHYSKGIRDPSADPQATGAAVIEVYNRRVDLARAKHPHTRLLVFLRNMKKLEFTIFERNLEGFVVNDYDWTVNTKGNLEARADGQHIFTWQPHGSQLTLVERVPRSSTRFRLTKRPAAMPKQQVLDLVGFTPDWVELIKS